MSEKKDFQNEEIKQLVVERLKTIPRDKKISIGGEGNFTVEEMIENVKKNNEVGQKIIEVQMKFLQSLKTGALLDE